ncbi:MAG: FAD-dependent oxidoreductase [Chloroflexi bacterium]|nr:FAD-dependent oxidoreductase [Chloroflexota bacterium]
MLDLIIIGGGPAGLTAAIYAIRKRLKVMLVSKDLGGKTNFRLELPWVEDYQVIRGLEVVTKFRNELEYLEFAHHLDGVESVEKREDNFVVRTRAGEQLKARALLVASGTRQLWLDVPGEREYVSRGLCYSALSYAPLFIDKTTVVIGEGELALRSAAELATVAQRVHLVGPDKAVLDSDLGRKLRRTKNVSILENHRVTEVLGNGYADRVIVKGPDGKLKEIKADGTFVERRLLPNTEFVKGLVDLDANGHIMIDSLNRTSAPGIFAAGDVTNIFAEQVLVAIGEGAKAALSAYDYLLPNL